MMKWGNKKMLKVYQANNRKCIICNANRFFSAKLYPKSTVSIDFLIKLYVAMLIDLYSW